MATPATPPWDTNNSKTPSKPRPSTAAGKSALKASYPTPGATLKTEAVSKFIDISHCDWDFSSLHVAFPNARRRVPVPIPNSDYPSPCIENHPLFNMDRLKDYRKENEFWDSWRIAWWKWHGHGRKEDHEELSDDEQERGEPLFEAAYTEGEPSEVSLARLRRNAEIQREHDKRAEARRGRNYEKRLKYQFGLKHRDFMSEKMNNVLWLPKKAGVDGIVEWDTEDPQVSNPLWNQSDILNMDPLLEPAHMLQFSVIDPGNPRSRNVWNGIRGAVHSIPIRDDGALREKIGDHKTADITRKSFPVDIRRIRNRAIAKTQDIYATEENFLELDKSEIFSRPDVVERYNCTQTFSLSKNWLEEWRRDMNYTGSQMPNEQQIRLIESRGERPRGCQFNVVNLLGGLEDAWCTPLEETSILHREQMDQEEFNANGTREHEFWMELIDDVEEDAEAYFLINLDPRTVVVNDQPVKQGQIAGPLPQFAVIEIAGQIGFWFGKNGLDYAPPERGRQDPVPFKNDDGLILDANIVPEDEKTDKDRIIDSLTGLKRRKAPDLPKKRRYKKYVDKYVDRPVQCSAPKRPRPETYKEPNFVASEGQSVNKQSHAAQGKEKKHLLALHDQCSLRGLNPIGTAEALQDRIDRYDRGERQSGAATESGGRTLPSPDPSDREVSRQGFRGIFPFGSNDDMRKTIKEHENAQAMLQGLTPAQRVANRKARIAHIDNAIIPKLQQDIKKAQDVLDTLTPSKMEAIDANMQILNSGATIAMLKAEGKAHQRAIELMTMVPIASETTAEVKLSKNQTMLKLSRQKIVERRADIALGEKVQISLEPHEAWYKRLVAKLDDDVRERVDQELELRQVDGIKETRDGHVDEELSDREALKRLLKAEQEGMGAFADPPGPKLDDSKFNALVRYNEQRRLEQELSRRLEIARNKAPSFQVWEERSELVRELRLTRELHKSINLMYATPAPLHERQIELSHLDAQWDASWDSPTELVKVNTKRRRFLHRYSEFMVLLDVVPTDPSLPTPKEVSEEPQEVPTLLNRYILQIWREQMDKIDLLRKEHRKHEHLGRTAEVSTRWRHLETAKSYENKLAAEERSLKAKNTAVTYASEELGNQATREIHLRQRLTMFEIAKETGNPLVNEKGQPLLDEAGLSLVGSVEDAIVELHTAMDEHDAVNRAQVLKAEAKKAQEPANNPEGSPSPQPPDELTGNPIIDFYSGGKDPIGQRTLHDFFKYSHQQLETSHDYIQVAFPTSEPSQHLKNAPLLDKEAFEAFRADRNLVRRMRRMFCYMLEFYGFGMDKPRKTSNGWRREIFEDTSPGVKYTWLKPSNHNHYRITRIIRCLRLVGMENDAQEFFQALERRCSNLPKTERPSDRSWAFWRSAAAWPLDFIPNTNTQPTEANRSPQWFLVEFEKHKWEYAETERARRADNLIVRLFTGGTDTYNRTLDWMISLPDHQLESKPDLFPLMFPWFGKSDDDMQAHQLDRTAFEAFHRNYKGMQDRLKKVLVRILKHYGMAIRWTISDYHHAVVEISKGEHYLGNSVRWLGVNKESGQMRIKRIIFSLRLAGLLAEAQELYNFVWQASVLMPPGKRSSNEVFRQWSNAVSRPLNIHPSMLDKDITDETGPEFLRQYEMDKAEEEAILAKSPSNMPYPAVIGPDTQPRSGVPSHFLTSPGGTPINAKKDEPVTTGRRRGRGGRGGHPSGRGGVGHGVWRGGAGRGGKGRGAGQAGTEKLEDPFISDTSKSSSRKGVKFSNQLVIPAPGPVSKKTSKRPTTAQLLSAGPPSTTPTRSTNVTKLKPTKPTTKTTKKPAQGNKPPTKAQLKAETAKKAVLAVKQAELDKQRSAVLLTSDMHISLETNRMNEELKDFDWHGELVPPDPSHQKGEAKGGCGYICANYVESGHAHILDMRDPQYADK